MERQSSSTFWNEPFLKFPILPMKTDRWSLWGKKCHKI
jgi:hypothetical protein